MLLNCCELRGISARKKLRDERCDQLRDTEMQVKLRICSGGVEGGAREIGGVTTRIFFCLQRKA